MPRKRHSAEEIVAKLRQAGGQGVEIPNTMNLPETLALAFNNGRSIRPSRSVWRKLNKAGVKFT